MADTWADAGVTFTAIKMNVLDTASNAASLLMDLQVGGSSRFRVDKAGAVVAPLSNSTIGPAIFVTTAVPNYLLVNGLFGFGSGGAAIDTILARDAANTLAQRNGTNAQTLRVYNTFTDASNYLRGFIRYNSNILEIGSEAAGTGTASAVRFFSGVSNSTFNWAFSSGGHFVAGTDNAYDIGASGANRPRNLYMGSWIRMATTTVASLPAAATAGAGARMFVTDASAPVFGSAVVGGGAVTVPVYSTGSAWNVG